MKTKKRFAQHLLKYPGDARRIADLLPATSGRILEIGSGAGALTAALLECHPTAKIMAVEFDRDMVAQLQARFGNEPRFEISQGDILNYDPSTLGAGLRVAGNLPYNISAPALDWTVKHREVIQDAVYMLQREVAERLAGAPGGKSWSPLAIMTQLYFDVNIRFTLAPDRFTPPPKVYSTVVSLSRRPGPELELPKLFERAVRAAFASRRKTLLNNLVQAFALPRKQVEEILDSLNFPHTVRAEELSTERFMNLAKALERHRALNAG